MLVLSQTAGSIRLLRYKRQFLQHFEEMGKLYAQKHQPTSTLHILDSVSSYESQLQLVYARSTEGTFKNCQGLKNCYLLPKLDKLKALTPRDSKNPRA